MAGNPESSNLWPDADVYTAPLGTAAPATVADPFGAGWDLVGLLDGSQGFAHSRDESVNDLFAWGGVLVRRSRLNLKVQTKFTAIEDNDVTRELVWPDSSESVIVVPRPKRILIAFETREGDRVQRLISKFQAEVEVDGDIVDKEDDLTKFPLVATIYPDASVTPAELWIRQFEAGSSS